MAKSDVKFVVSTLDTNDRTAELNLPKALDRWEGRLERLPKFEGGLVRVSGEDNDWANADLVTVPEAVVIAKLRLDDVDRAGIDLFARGKRPLLKMARTERIRSIEKYEPGAAFNYSGDMSPELRKLCEDLWAEFGDDPSLSNGGIHVCRKIAGSSSWSQHSWYDAIDLMIGSDMALGDAIYRWLKANENKYGGYAELLWRVASHYDHLHNSLAPRHLGTPPCAA